MVFPKTKNHNSKEKAVENILYEKYNSYYRMAMSYVHNESDAMDIVQEGAYKLDISYYVKRGISFSEKK